MTEPGILSCLNFRCDPFPPETWRQPAAFRSWMSSRILRGISRPNKLTPDLAIWPRRWPRHLSQLRRRVDELPRYRDQSGSGRLRPEPRLRVAKSWLSDANCETIEHLPGVGRISLFPGIGELVFP